MVGILSREKIFTNFAVSICVVCPTSNPQKFSLQNLFFSQIHKSFLTRKIPHQTLLLLTREKKNFTKRVEPGYTYQLVRLCLALF